MKKLLSALLAGCFVFSLAACGGGDGDGQAQAGQPSDNTPEGTSGTEAPNPLEGLYSLGDAKGNGESYKILAVHDNLGEFHVTFYQGAVYAAEEIKKNYGIDVSVDFVAGSGTVTDMSEFNGMIEQGVNEGYHAILCPGYNATSTANAWEYAKSKNVPIFAWWGTHMPEFDSQVTAWCVNDTDAQCEKITRYMVDYVKAKGETPKIVIMSQGNTDNETIIVDATTKICKELGVDVKTVIVTTDSATQIEAISNAYQADSSWNIWIAYTGEAGVSAATVFKEFGVTGQMYVAGIDATSTHLDCLENGTNVCLLEQGVYSAGYTNCYQAVDYLLDGSLDSMDYIEITNNEIVSMDNYDGWRSVNNIVMDAINAG